MNLHVLTKWMRVLVLSVLLVPLASRATDEPTVTIVKDESRKVGINLKVRLDTCRLDNSHPDVASAVAGTGSRGKLFVEVTGHKEGTTRVSAIAVASGVGLGMGKRKAPEAVTNSFNVVVLAERREDVRTLTMYVRQRVQVDLRLPAEIEGAVACTGPKGIVTFKKSQKNRIVITGKSPGLTVLEFDYVIPGQGSEPDDCAHAILAIEVRATTQKWRSAQSDWVGLDPKPRPRVAKGAGAEAEDAEKPAAPRRRTQTESHTIYVGQTLNVAMPKGAKIYAPVLLSPDTGIVSVLVQKPRLIIRGKKKGTVTLRFKYRVERSKGEFEYVNCVMEIEVKDPPMDDEGLSDMDYQRYIRWGREDRVGMVLPGCPLQHGNAAVGFAFGGFLDGGPIDGRTAVGGQYRMPFEQVPGDLLSRVPGNEYHYLTAGFFLDAYSTSGALEDASGWTATLGAGTDWWLDSVTILNRVCNFGVGAQAYGLYSSAEGDYAGHAACHNVQIGTMPCGTPIYGTQCGTANGTVSDTSIGVGVSGGARLYTADCRWGVEANGHATLQEGFDFGEAGSTGNLGFLFEIDAILTF